ncbi:MAG: hypothetical protein KBT20_10865 [Bacteroidales bacterium]|nr:hypothetical protein [Candidatus Liminaster caballi]
MCRLTLKVLLLSLLALPLTVINAQTDEAAFTNKSRHEVSLGYGTPCFFFDLMSNIFNQNDVKFPVNIHSQYMYNISKHFSVGASLSYSAYYEELREWKDCSTSGKKIGRSDFDHLFSFGLTGRAYWFYKSNWAMYSKYGITLTAKTDDNDLFFLPYNISFVGVEVGRQQWRGYIEPLCLFSTWPSVHAGVKYLF